MGPKMYPSALPPAWLVCVVSAAAKTAIGDQYQTRKGGREDERGRKLLCPWAPPPLSPVIIAIAKTTGADKVVARYPSKTQKRQSNKGSGKLVVGIPMGTLCMWFPLAWRHKSCPILYSPSIPSHLPAWECPPIFCRAQLEPGSGFHPFVHVPRSCLFSLYSLVCPLPDPLSMLLSLLLNQSWKKREEGASLGGQGQGEDQERANTTA